MVEKKCRPAIGESEAVPTIHFTQPQRLLNAPNHLKTNSNYMKTATFIARCRLPYPAAEVFGWHLRPGAFERLNPPWDAAEIIERSRPK